MLSCIRQASCQLISAHQSLCVSPWFLPIANLCVPVEAPAKPEAASAGRSRRRIPGSAQVVAGYLRRSKRAPFYPFILRSPAPACRPPSALSSPLSLLAVDNPPPDASPSRHQAATPAAARRSSPLLRCKTTTLSLIFCSIRLVVVCYALSLFALHLSFTSLESWRHPEPRFHSMQS